MTPTLSEAIGTAVFLTGLGWICYLLLMLEAV